MFLQSVSLLNIRLQGEVDNILGPHVLPDALEMVDNVCLQVRLLVEKTCILMAIDQSTIREGLLVTDECPCPLSYLLCHVDVPIRVMGNID